MEYATTAYIGLGSNLGDRFGQLKTAVTRLHAHTGIRVARCSSVYETAPVGLTEQPHFLNMAIEVETTLPPLDLLDVLLGVEQSMGRVRTVRWGPRTIDLDLLVYGDAEMRTDRLELPHPRMEERAFVLVPLLELCDAKADGGHKARDRWRKALDTAEGKDEVRLWTTTNWRSESGRFEN
jgi:2-amino-4-hydroxy-6-hydroxymethyldihydropteridine diphosphokinase